MDKSKHITIISNRKKLLIDVTAILYVIITNKVAEIHISNGKTYETRMTISQFEKMFGGDFIKINRGCLVSVIAIHEITDKIYLNNGEALVYTTRKKHRILEQFNECNVYSHKECKDCFAKLYCSGGCAANAYHTT